MQVLPVYCTIFMFVDNNLPICRKVQEHFADSSNVCMALTTLPRAPYTLLRKTDSRVKLQLGQSPYVMPASIRAAAPVRCKLPPAISGGKTEALLRLDSATGSQCEWVENGTSQYNTHGTHARRQPQRLMPHADHMLCHRCPHLHSAQHASNPSFLSAPASCVSPLCLS